MTPSELMALASQLSDGWKGSSRLDAAAAALRSYAELLAALGFFAFNVGAAKRWDECDTQEDIVRIAKECGWPGLEEA